MPEKTTMRDVARAAAVSVTTVSRVINGDPYVATETSLRVRQSIADLDYRINPLARSLRTGSDEAVGLLVETIGDPFFASVIGSVEEAARAAGLFLLIASAGENAEQERAVVTGLLNRSVQGMLIVPCHLSYRSERLPIGPDGVPVVFIDRPSSGTDADTVIIDNAANARMATEHLIAHHHRRIGFAGTEVSRYPVSERLVGFRDALAAHSLLSCPRDLVDLHHRGHGPETHLLDALLAPPDPVTAIVTADATASQAVVREMHRIGRTDVAVVSFDDFPMADALDPAITVALQDPVEMGTRAFELLLGRIRGEQGPPRRLVLPTTFIERGSGELIPPTIPERPSTATPPDVRSRNRPGHQAMISDLAREPVLVGVDVGTSRTKAGIVDVHGRELACVSVPTSWRVCQTGGDTSGAALSAGVREALRAVLTRCPAGEVVALGVTSVAETVVVLDAHGAEVAPAIAWYDTRASGDHRALLDELHPQRITGLYVDAIPSVAMLHWLSTHDPTTMQRARRVLSVAEWIVRDLGGVTAAEPSLASRTGALAIADRAWWPEAIGWAGFSPDLFSELRQAGTSWGAVRGGIPDLESLEGATLTAAGHDHLVAAIGSGLTTTGQVMDSCGTAEALLRPIPVDPALDLTAVVARGVNCGWHVLPGLYNLIVGLRLGLDLAPLLGRLGSYSRGGRTPLDEQALAWLAADSRSDGPPEVRAWAEATSSAVSGASRALEELRELGGPIDEVLIGGGWAANPVLHALKQAAFPHPVYPQVTEPGVRGAALLAAQAAGLFADATDFPAPPLQQIPDAEETPVP